VNAARIVILHDNVPGLKFVTINVAETIPAQGEEPRNTIKSSFLALTDFPMSNRKLLNAVNPLGANNTTAALGQIPTVV
jgi:hypothetical protein